MYVLIKHGENSVVYIHRFKRCKIFVTHKPEDEVAMAYYNTVRLQLPIHIDPKGTCLREKWLADYRLKSKCEWRNKMQRNYYANTHSDKSGEFERRMVTTHKPITEMTVA